MTDLSELLRDTARAVDDTDLLDRVEAAVSAHRRRVRRRWAAGLAATALGAAAVAVLAPSGVVTPRPAPDPALRQTPLAPDGRLVGTSLGAVGIFEAPPPSGQATLPVYPERGAVALPERLGFDPRDTLPRLQPQSLPVRALLGRWRSGKIVPVAYIPGAEEPYVELPLEVEPDPMHGTLRLGPHSIDAAGHRVLLIQGRDVVIVDTRAASVTEVPVDLGRRGEDPIECAQWTPVSEHIEVVSSTARVLVDPATRTVTPLAPAAVCSAGWRTLTTDSTGAALVSLDAARAVISERRLPGPVSDMWSSRVENIEAWVAGGVFLDQGRVPGYQGILAVQEDSVLRPKILMATDAPGVQKGTFVALGWGPRDVLLLSAATSQRPDTVDRRVLAWDVIEDRLYQVGTIAPSGSGEGDFTGDLALRQ